MADIAKTKTEDLLKELVEKREALRVFRFSAAGSRIRNTREGRGIRKEIARVLTELNKRKTAATSLETTETEADAAK